MMGRLLRFALALCCVPAAFANIWDAAGNFSNSLNPNGTWSYLYTLPQGTPSLFTQPVTNPVNGWAGWSTNLGIPDSIYIYQNVSGVNYYQNNRFIPNDSLQMDPEGGVVSVEFTAPLAGQYTIAGYFLAADTALSSHPYSVQVAQGSQVLWSSTLSNFDDSNVFDLTENLASGDSVNFSVLTGYPADSCPYCFLSTAFEAVVSVDQTPVTGIEPPGLPTPPTPEPGMTMPLFIGVGLLAACCRRRADAQRVASSRWEPFPRYRPRCAESGHSAIPA